jgi:hypothetical protein
MEFGKDMTAREVLHSIQVRADSMPEVAAAFETLVPVLELYLYAEVDPAPDKLQAVDDAWRRAGARLRQLYGLRDLLRARLSL